MDYICSEHILSQIIMICFRRTQRLNDRSKRRRVVGEPLTMFLDWLLKTEQDTIGYDELRCRHKTEQGVVNEDGKLSYWQKSTESKGIRGDLLVDVDMRSDISTDVQNGRDLISRRRRHLVCHVQPLNQPFMAPPSQPTDNHHRSKCDREARIAEFVKHLGDVLPNACTLLLTFSCVC